MQLIATILKASIICYFVVLYHDLISPKIATVFLLKSYLQFFAEFANLRATVFIIFQNIWIQKS